MRNARPQAVTAPMIDLLDHGRDAMRRNAWAEALEALTAADAAHWVRIGLHRAEATRRSVEWR